MVHWSDISDILKWYIGKIPPRISQSTPAAFPCKLIQLSVPHSTFVYYFCEISTPRQQHWKLKTENSSKLLQQNKEISVNFDLCPAFNEFTIFLCSCKRVQNDKNVKMYLYLQSIFAINICNQYLKLIFAINICN